jgi:hypothetical protein
VISRLDYLVAVARQGTPRIDWWNQFVGALFTLVLSSVIPPHVFQTILSLAAHGLAALFGGAVPALPPPTRGSM